MGVFATLFLIVLAVTGIVLNHTEFFRLDHIKLQHPLILKRYGMMSLEEIRSYQIHETEQLVHFGDTLYYNEQMIAKADDPLAILDGSMLTAIVTKHSIVQVTRSGELIEKMNTDQLPFTEIIFAGWSKEHNPVLRTDEGDFVADADWIDLIPYKGNLLIEPLSELDLSTAEKVAFSKRFQGDGISLYRVILDLHSGRLFGIGGRTMMDLSALAIILLILSGIGGWVRKSKRKTKGNAR